MGGRDVALLTGLWQQRDSGADEDDDEEDFVQGDFSLVRPLTVLSREKG